MANSPYHDHTPKVVPYWVAFTDSQPACPLGLPKVMRKAAGA